MIETTTRIRIVTAMHEGTSTAIGLALAILRSAGVNTMYELSSAIGGGEFDVPDAECIAAFSGGQAVGVETLFAYPDRVYQLEDGTVLIAARSEAEEFGIVVGGEYADEVMMPAGAAADRGGEVALDPSAAAGMAALASAEAQGAGPETAAGAGMGAAAFAAEKEANEADHTAQRDRDAALFDQQEPDEADPADPDHPSNLGV